MEGAVDIKTLLYIIIGIITIGGAIVGFFQMQTKQNMKLEQLDDKVKELERKQTVQTGYQIETEKSIIGINGKLDHILEAIEELKKQRC